MSLEALNKSREQAQSVFPGDLEKLESAFEKKMERISAPGIDFSEENMVLVKTKIYEIIFEKFQDEDVQREYNQLKGQSEKFDFLDKYVFETEEKVD